MRYKSICRYGYYFYTFFISIDVWAYHWELFFHGIDGYVHTFCIIIQIILLDNVCGVFSLHFPYLGIFREYNIFWEHIQFLISCFVTFITNTLFRRYELRRTERHEFDYMLPITFCSFFFCNSPLSCRGY